MTCTMTTGQNRALRVAGAALGFFALTAAAAQNAATTVYRCTQADGAVLYADYPCTGSVVVDIKHDAIDPAAGERLERARSEFDRAAARRKADEEIAALYQDELNQRRGALDAVASDADSATAMPGVPYVAVYGFDAPRAKHRTKASNRHRRAGQHRIVQQGRVPAVALRPQRQR